MASNTSRKPPLNLNAMALNCAKTALQAGAAILQVRQQGILARVKADRSLVCQADESAEKIIIEALTRLYADIPIVAEEAYAAGLRTPASDRFFLVDALDGTADFVAGQNGFTVNIGLIDNGVPVMGVVYAPASGKIWFSGENAYGCSNAEDDLPARQHWQALQVRPAPEAGLTALVSQRHAESRCRNILQALPIAAHKARSSSIKFCLIASGEADLYPRFSPTMQWDTAAGQAILLAAGGEVLSETGAPLRYHIQDNMRNPGFVALGDPALKPALVMALQQTRQV